MKINYSCAFLSWNIQFSEDNFLFLLLCGKQPYFFTIRATMRCWQKWFFLRYSHIIYWYLQIITPTHIWRSIIVASGTIYLFLENCGLHALNISFWYVQASMLWRKRVTALATEYPDVELSHMYVDNAAMQLVRNPKQVPFIFQKDLILF